MKTKLIRLMWALFVGMVCMGVNAQTSGNCGSPNAADVQWSYAGGTLTFTGTGAMNMYSENQPQAPWWNDYMTTTTTVVVGEGITTIPHWGFAMFENLTSVTLPSTLTTIGKAALEECAFTTIDLPEGLTTIGDYSFQIGALTSITIPSTVTYIGEVAFQAMESLTSVTFLGSDPTTITFGDNIFQDCNNLTAINVPAGKVDAYKAALPDYAALIVEGGAPTPATSGSCGTNATWSYSNGIMTIGGSGAMTDFSSSMTDIPWIDYQTNITKVVIGDEITHVGDWAFQGCTALNSVTIGEKVTSIGNGSFDNCTNDGFTMLTIPNSVQTIGIDAFSNNHLKYVCFGSGLTSIGMEAFMVCQDLEAIGVSASTPPTLGMEAFMACSNLASIYVPSSKITDYKDANGWSDYAAMIKSPEGECGTDATWSFEMATGVLTIEGTGAIDDFSGWDSTQANDSRAFNPLNTDWYPCGIKNVVIGEGITDIPGNAFYMEVGITDVTLPSTLTAIGLDAFGECENIETITCDATTPPTLADDGNESYVFYGYDAEWNVVPISTITAINVPAASVATYKAAAGWSDYAEKIVAQGGAPAVTTTFTYTATAKETRFDTYAKFTGATAVKSHEFADGAGTVVYEGTVTEIQGDAFRAAGGSNTNLTSITIPESVTSLAANALRKSTALTTVNFAGTPTLTTIGNYVFASCSTLANITLPASVTTIGGQAFSDCTALTTFDVPEGVTSIGGQAFGGCSNLTAINFTGTPTLTSIGGSAFYNCKKLTTLTLPESLTTIGNDVFNGAGITSIFIPKNVSNVGEGLSYGCEITSLSVDPDNATYDSRNDCNAVIETVTNKLVAGCRNTVIPNGIVTLGTFAFAQFSGSFSLTIPESVTTFEFGAIHMCPGLTTVNIPSGITSMDDMLFGGCNCIDVYCYIEDPATLTWSEGGAMAFANNKATKFHVKEGTSAAWETAFPNANVTFVEGLPAPATTTFTYTATAKVTAFDEYEKFTGATALASHDYADGAGTVVYNGTVTALESGAFYYNDTKEALTAITLPESLTALGDDAFRGCTGLTTVTFDGTPALTTINKRAFKDCSALAAIAIPASVETIGGGAFSDCSELASVTFPGTSALTAIGSTAFSNCESLAAITLPESVTTIGEGKNGSVFSGAGLTSFVLPKNLTTICGGGHFRNCPMTSLTVNADNAKYEDRGSNAIIEKATDKLVLGCIATTVPDGIKVIGNEAFFGEELPFSLTLPESVTTIEARAFHYATGLTAINIPSKVTEIPDETFAQCNFTELVIPDGVTSIGGMAFMMCMSLKTITFGSGLTTIENWAFECPNVTDIYCYATPFTTWNGNGFANAKATKFHVADAKAWGTAFPSANVTFVDDLNAFTLAEDVDNTAAIAGRNGHEANVTLTRTLKAGSYNTFAVPFDIDAATLTAQGITAKKLTASSLDGTTLTLTFADATTIEAGKPYLVKVAADVENPTFAGVTVSSTVSTTETDNVDLVPMMGKTLVTGPEGDKDNTKAVLFLASNNTLVYPTVVNDASQEASYMKGFRAYFQLKGAAADPASVKSFAINFGDETGIISLTPNHSPVSEGSIYMLDGRRVSSQQAQNGVYIVNGKKVIIK